MSVSTIQQQLLELKKMFARGQSMVDGLLAEVAELQGSEGSTVQPSSASSRLASASTVAAATQVPATTSRLASARSSVVSSSGSSRVASSAQDTPAKVVMLPPSAGESRIASSDMADPLKPAIIPPVPSFASQSHSHAHSRASFAARHDNVADSPSQSAVYGSKHQASSASRAYTDYTSLVGWPKTE